MIKPRVLRRRFPSGCPSAIHGCTHLTGALLMALIGISGCSERASLRAEATMGPSPQLAIPVHAVIPTVNIAPAKGWPTGTTPDPTPGLAVNAYASGLDHPRWLYVLPNGDVLVAETNAPPKPDDGTGIKGHIMKWVMARAGIEQQCCRERHAE